MPQYAHQRYNSAPPANQQKRMPRFFSRPDEMPSDRSAQLNCVVGLQLTGEVRRHLAVIQTINREFQRGDLGWRGNRVASFRTVAVLALEAYVRVLPGRLARPHGA